MSHKIRLVSFDLLHTLIIPRVPIHVSYGRVLEPFVGPLDPEALKSSFRTALRQLQAEKPLYGGDTTSWWSEVIRRTALGAGAEPRVLDASLSHIVPRLMASFNSRAGYKPFDDFTMDVLHSLRNDLKVYTAVVSNADSRMLSVLKDLGFPNHLNPIILSETEGVEKPSADIFRLMLQRANARIERPIMPAECLHVGDEWISDCIGARDAGMSALLLKRPDADDEGGFAVPEERIEVVEDMLGVLEWVKARC